METSSPGPEAGQADPKPPAPGPAGGGGETIAIPCDADRDDDVDVLYLAGQLPSDDGEWLLVSEVDGLPGAAFTVSCLPRDAWHGHGGDVLVSLQPDIGSQGQPRPSSPRCGQSWAAT